MEEECLGCDQVLDMPGHNSDVHIQLGMDDDRISERMASGAPCESAQGSSIDSQLLEEEEASLIQVISRVLNKEDN